jgi:hypothetical protein
VRHAAVVVGERLAVVPPGGLMTRSRREAFGQRARMTGAFHRVIAPQVRPILVEERLEADIPPGVTLSGRPDTVAHEPGRVRDLKNRISGQSRWSRAQLGAYALLARTHGLEIDDAAIDYVQRVAPSPPQPHPVSKAVPIAAAETAAPPF